MTLSLKARDLVLRESSTVFCVGRNYKEHAAEMDAIVPATPAIFLKPPTALRADGAAITLPPTSSLMNHEVEITVLIGQRAKNISAGDARSVIAGYGVGFDMTLRDVQTELKKQSLPWAAAKSFDGSAPVSDFIPPSEITDPSTLGIRLFRNGEVKQAGTASEMIFNIPALISFISKLFTLREGDILFTGTPKGVGPVVAGDVIRGELLASDGNVLTSVSLSLY